MALARRSGRRFEANIWPGFVDAMTALLLVLFFVLTIFMIVQFVLRDTITQQDDRLDDFSNQIADLAQALGLEQQSNFELENELGAVNQSLDTAEDQVARQTSLIATLSAERDSLNAEAAAAAARISNFEEQVAGLLARNRDLDASLVAARGRAEELDTELASATAQADAAERDLSAARASIAALEDANSREISAKEALQLALAQARDEVDEGTEAARLAAAQREAMEALLADLRAQAEQDAAELAENETALAEQQAALTEAERAQALDAAAAAALRRRLAESSEELTAMTLNLEAERKKAEDTLTLLASARAARAALEAEKEALSAEVAANLSDTERDRALLALAQQELSDEQQLSLENQRRVALLNQQTEALRNQLNALQGLLDEAKAKDDAAQVQMSLLGQNLNTALARAAAEQKKRAELEEAERKRLEVEAQDLASYRSEFFGRVREIIAGREGIQVVGDRFVFSSEVLFGRGSATLGSGGRAQLADVASVIREIAPEIPPEIDWVLRVDGHTDNIPLSGGGSFADNWELSQARALSVVRYLIANENIPADRLAANGFGEFQPIDTGTTPDALARNRRIELKFTEK